MDETTEDQPRLLVVDDEKPIRDLIRIALQKADNYRFFEAGDGVEAQDILLREPIDVAITDLAMPRMGGEDLIHWARDHCPDVSWIILTGRGTMAAAVEAVRMGAFDFVPKGTDTIKTLVPRVRNAVRERRHAQETKRLHARIEQQNIRLQEQVDKLRDACQLLSQQAEFIQEDFSRAAGIQRALLPREAPDIEGVAVDAVYRPCDRVGGDLYDVARLDDHRLGICVADAAGHGVAAAMLAVVFKNRLCPTDPDTNEPRQPQDVLADINDQLVDECRTPRMFVSAAYCLLDTETNEIAIASAGHPPVLVHRSDGGIQRVGHSGPALGLTEGATFEQTLVPLHGGDRVLLYTDGLFQATKGRPALTSDRIADILAAENLEGIELLRELLNNATEQQEGRQRDDITLLVLSRTPVASEVDNGAPSKPIAATVSQEASGFELAFGRCDCRTVIRLQGRADWTYAAAFHEACVSALNDGTPLAIDMSPCPHMDSTFLGTIHELVIRAEQAGVAVTLHGVSEPIRSLFEELGMTRVLDHLADQGQPLPDRLVTLQDAADPQASQQRVLRAHEALASINDENHRQFGKLIEYLRQEIQADGAV